MHEPFPKANYDDAKTIGPSSSSARRKSYHRLIIASVAVMGVAIFLIAVSLWLGSKASTIKTELEAAKRLVGPLQEQVINDPPGSSSQIVDAIRARTEAAQQAANDPLWTLASSVPIIGSNVSAITELARSADDVATLALAPLVEVYGSLNWDALLPSSSDTNLEPLKAASPRISAAADAVRLSAERLERIETKQLLPQVADPVTSARDELRALTASLDAAADVSKIAPPMLGEQSPRKYLLMIQNNAEARTSGGIPGALAVVELDKGKLTLGSQTSASAIGPMSPLVPVDSAQQQIYSGRMGKFMQDVNLTPDFPTAASTALAIWERKEGQRLEGVISIDPVALSYILDSTGPVKLPSTEAPGIASVGLPAELTASNVVPTLLSDVYAKIEDPALQDVFFAGVAQEIFTALADGRGSAQEILHGLIRGSAEGRILLWSEIAEEQDVIGKYPVSGSIAGPSVAPAQFGVYFNDGTGAKMDYYVKRTVQILKACPRDGYEEVTVKIISSNTAPENASTALPAYVTGNGKYGVPPGSIQTNVVAYGPVQAQIEWAKVDGKRTNFAPYVHSNRPVGVLAIRLAPGESKAVEYTFGKIVQHTEPNLVVTPTVQPVKNVILPTVPAACE